MKRKKIIRYILLSFLLITAAAALYIYKEFNRTHTDTGKLKPDFSVAAAALLEEFVTDERSSEKKYWDKVIRVEGVLKGIETDDKGFFTLALGDTSSMTAVRCSIDSAHNHEVKGVRKGTVVAIKGICSGYTADELLGSDVILVRCVIDQKK